MSRAGLKHRCISVAGGVPVHGAVTFSCATRSLLHVSTASFWPDRPSTLDYVDSSLSYWASAYCPRWGAAVDCNALPFADAGPVAETGNCGGSFDGTAEWRRRRLTDGRGYGWTGALPADAVRALDHGPLADGSPRALRPRRSLGTSPHTFSGGIADGLYWVNVTTGDERYA